MGSKGSRGNNGEEEIWELMVEGTKRVKRSKGCFGERGKYKSIERWENKGKKGGILRRECCRNAK